MTHWERLSALDASFLGIETDNTPMHVGALVILEAGPQATEHGGIDGDRLREYLGATLGALPRYRQRLEWVPGLRHPVWVDDQHFNIHYHVRHTALPRPGDERMLKRLAGRIFSQRLDRTRPLWEMWVVEGLDGDRFALISKIHHCMIDGVAGVDLMTALMRGTPDDSIPEAPAWEPRPAPTRTQLLASEVEHRTLGSRTIFDRVRKAVSDPTGWWAESRDTAQGLASSLMQGLQPASPTPLNPKSIGPYRRFDTCRLDLGAVKDTKNRLGGKVNDIVLATASGAIAKFLSRRGTRVEDIHDFRALVPVSVRASSEHGAGGNKVAMMLAQLPVDEPDPVRRLQLVRETTNYLKTESRQVQSSQLIEELSDLTATSLVREVFRIAGRQRAYNVVITNVPGPPFPLYFLGSKIQEVYPLVPLFGRQSLGIALFSYAGSLFWGLVGDWQGVPDLHELVGDLESAFEELRTSEAPPEAS